MLRVIIVKSPCNSPDKGEDKRERLPLSFPSYQRGWDLGGFPRRDAFMQNPDTPLQDYSALQHWYIELLQPQIC